MSNLPWPRRTPRTSRQPVEGRAAFALVVTLVFWASAFAGIRAGLQGYSAGALVLARFLVASGALGLYAAITRMRMPDVRDIPMMLFLGFIGITVYQVCLTFGELSVTAGTASFLVASVPCFTALLALFLLKERVSTFGWLGIFVSFLGVTIISFGGGSGLTLTPGALLIVLASFSESIYFILQKRYSKKYSGLELTTYAMWAATLWMLVFLPELGAHLFTAPLGPTLAIVYLGLFPAALAYTTWTYALLRLPAAIATNFLNISPILAILISWVWLHEVPRPIEFVGGIVVVSGVLIVNTLGRRGTPRAAEASQEALAEIEKR